MLEGRVTVNGQTIRELGTKADAAHDDIRVDGRRIRLPERHIYILLNKPKSYVTTRSDPEKRRPSSISSACVNTFIGWASRLRFQRALLILTNDSDLAPRMTSEARIAGLRASGGVPDEHDVQRLRHGVVIEGERTGPADVQLVGVGPTSIVGIREGRNRQIRKMCESIGHPVDHLRRVAIGPIRDDRLKVGHWRELTEAEVNKLRWAVANPTTKESSVVKAGVSTRAPASRPPGASPSARRRGASRGTPDRSTSRLRRR